MHLSICRQKSVLPSPLRGGVGGGGASCEAEFRPLERRADTPTPNPLPAGGRGLCAALLTLLPTAVLAHPGDHSTMSLAQGMHHLFTEPDHLGMIAAVAAVAAGGWIMRTRRAR
ncbi:MAG: hypothetical protein JWP23_1838 [Phenylobacterium sp.]|nr:hypothetical protein [Phenylobacterium sp.]